MKVFKICQHIWIFQDKRTFFKKFFFCLKILILIIILVIIFSFHRNILFLKFLFLSQIVTLDSRALLFSRACFLKKGLPKGREKYDVGMVGARIPRKIVVTFERDTNKISSKKREKISPGAEGAQIVSMNLSIPKVIYVLAFSKLTPVLSL